MDNEVLEGEEQNTVTGSGEPAMEEDLPEVKEEVPESGSTEEPKEELPEEDQNKEKEETKQEKAVDPLGTENLAANAQIYSTLALQDMNIGDNTKKEKKA